MHATTAFTADDHAVEAKPTALTTQRHPALDSFDYSSLSLHDLLSQPVPVFSGALDGAFSPLSFFSHTTLVQTSAFHRRKLEGYMGIRATVVVRLVVNADKYTQGRYALAYVPHNTDRVPNRRDHRLITQLHHVELDLNVDTEVTLRVPHRGPYTHFDVQNNRFNTGTFFISNILPQRGNPVPATVYFSFEDIDLLGPTSLTQTGYQSGLHVEEQTKKPLSEKVKEIGSVMTVAGNIPILGSYIQPMAWATAVAGNVLSAFGYSKPCTTTTPEVYKERAIPKLNHSDGTDWAEQAAMTTTTGVKVTDQIGLTTADEMSIAFLVGIKSQIHRFTYSTLTVAGSKILTFPLSPAHMKSQYAADVGGVIGDAEIMHPMCFVQNMFAAYRGSIEVTLDISKTIFHTGRLMVVFEPIGSDYPGTVAQEHQSRITDIASAVNCHKDIIDLRSGNTFSFKFPFTSFTPYLQNGVPYGFCHIFVLNNLVKNDAAVSEEVDVGVKVAGCSDMEFAGPIDPVYYPADYIGNEVLSEVLDPETIDAVDYESGLEVSDSMIVSKPIGRSREPNVNTALSELCVGEKIMSLKQVAMRGKLVSNSRAGRPDNSDPFAVDLFKTPSTATHAVVPFMDFYSMVGSLYAYSRGGAIVSVANYSSLRVLCLSVTVQPGYANTGTALDNRYGEFDVTIPIMPQTTERVYIPPYNQGMVRYNRQSPQATQFKSMKEKADIFGHHGYSQTKFYIHNIDLNGELTGGHVYYRSAAEDTQFGGFSGVPVMQFRSPYAIIPNFQLNRRALVGGFPNS